MRRLSQFLLPIAILAIATVAAGCGGIRIPSGPSNRGLSPDPNSLRGPATVRGFYVGSGNWQDMLGMRQYMNGLKVPWAGDYAGWDGPTPWGVSQWATIDQPHVLWSMWFLPPLTKDKTADPVGWLNEVRNDLTAAANGAFDDHWLAVGRRMAASSRQGKDAVRIGWELGGEWYAWGSRVFSGAGDLQKQAWEHYARAIRASGWNVKTVWDSEDLRYLPNPDLIDVVTAGGYDAPANGWAGCGIGGHNPDGTWLHPDGAWNCVEQGMGPRLQRSAALARLIGKPMGIAEWGLSYGNDDTYFVQKMHDFIVSNNVMFDIYFQNDNNSSWSEMHRLEHFPNAGALYHKLFTQS